MTCPDCNGEKTLNALVNRGEKGCAWESIPCITCHGAGKVPESYLAARAEGGRRRAERIARGETLMEMSRRTGIGVVELSRQERGAE